MGELLRRIKNASSDILIGEEGAFLHDMGKCQDRFISGSGKGYKVVADPNKFIEESELDANKYPILKQMIKILKKEYFTLFRNQPGNTVFHYLANHIKDFLLKTNRSSVSIAELVMFSLPNKFFSQDGFENFLKNKKSIPWIRLLSYCHGIAHIEKEDVENISLPQKFYNSTAFGFENPSEPIQGLTGGLNSISFDNDLIFKQLEKLFSKALGDTRHPINEVNLWDWSYMVASLYKSALAEAIIEKDDTKRWKTKIDLKWSILSLNFNLHYLYAKAIKIGDILGYKRMIKYFYKQLKYLIEKKYPLGNEIYRDEFGIHFTCPGIDRGHELFTEIKEEIESLILYSLPEEVRPQIKLEIGKTGKNDLERLPLLGNIINKSREKSGFPLSSPIVIRDHETTGNVCPLCQLRLNGDDSNKDTLCAVCKKRRDEVRKAKNDDTTIWIDEVVDKQKRAALLIAQFDLTHWLDGSMTDTLLVNPDAKKEENRFKNPSPARIYRFWKTTQTFFDQALDEIKKVTTSDEMRCKRLILTLKTNNLNKKKVYDGTLNGYPISIFRDNNGQWITISNLQWLVNSEDESITKLAQRLSKKESTLRVRSEDDREWEEITVSGALITEGNVPIIPVTQSPDRFWLMIPAEQALEITQKIKEKYKKEMSKVRDRLPLHMGLIFFPRKTPLFAVMEAGRRMSKAFFKAKNETWNVLNSNDVPGQNKIQHLKLGRPDNSTVCWHVSYGFADPDRTDYFYPYFRTDGADLEKREYTFPVPGAESHHRVHVSKLEPGDNITIQPSRFGFTFLESSARRFQADDSIRYLEDIDAITNLWGMLKGKGISDTTLRNGWAVIENALASIGKTEPWRKLVETTLNVQWGFMGNQLEEMKQAVYNGLLEDCLELYLKILKERLGGKENGKQ